MKHELNILPFFDKILRMPIAIVTNTLAGNGKAARLAAKIQGMLTERNFASLVFTENEWDDRVSDFDQVWIVGGDGTLNYFINRYPAITKPLCIFKGGTGNDFHALLYGNTTVEEQVALVLQSKPKPIDTGRCNEKFFLNGVGIGFEGAVAKSLQGVKKWSGKTSFMFSILKHIFFYKEQLYSVSSGEKTKEADYLMISVANGTRYGGGFYVAPLARPDDGLLDANLVSPLSPFKRLRYLPVIEKGKHLGLPFIDHYQTRKIMIRSNRPIQAHLDGEYLESNELQIEILPARFNFIY